MLNELETSPGVKVVEVQKGSIADRIGIVPGDVRRIRWRDRTESGESEEIGRGIHPNSANYIKRDEQ